MIPETPTADASAPPLTRRIPDTGYDLAFDPGTGLLAGITADGAWTAGVACRMVSAVCLVVGGGETRGAFGGLDFPGAAEITDSRLREVGPLERTPEGVRVRVSTDLGPARLRWTYTIRTEAPRLRVDVVLTHDGEDELVVRDFRIAVAVAIERAEAPGFVINAPGNRIRTDLPVADLADAVTVNSAGGTPGSSGLMVLEERGCGRCLLVWPLARAAIGHQSIDYQDGSLTMEVDTGLAGAIRRTEQLSYGPLYLDALDESWDRLRHQIAGWYGPLGVSLPADAPAWTTSASIFEVQIGESLFAGHTRYAPYPTVRNLIADLDRIVELGFDALQIMPRQPFPSYNVVDYADIDATYGDKRDLLELISRAHRRGMRVILDVIMHGVLDREYIRLAAEAVRTGPHGPFLTSRRSFSLQEAASLPDVDRVPWSAHILDFEEAWAGGAPEQHPLPLAHPDWFCRDSAGAIIGVYTKAFDLGNREWQDHFEAALRHLIDELDIDGFRFDAPTYNSFPNWSPHTRSQASACELASIDLFARLRADLKPDHPELMFYTEPSGVLLRESMDLNYNYDEHAQLEDLVGFQGAALGARGRSTAGIRNARELASWFRDRDASLPPHAVTAHHIDSHDTFWWPRPGQKWRREQVGVRATTALASIFALSGGPYMTFVGGELGIEDHLKRIHRLRRVPDIARGAADFDAVEINDPRIYAVVRRLGDVASLVLVNVSGDEVDVEIRLRGHSWVEDAVDLLSGEPFSMRWPQAAAASRAPSTRVVSLAPYATFVVQIRPDGEGHDA